MEIMTEAHKLVPGDLCDTDGDIARVLHGAGATAIPAFAEVVCVEFPDKDRVRIVFASLGTVTMPSQYLVPVVYVQQPAAPRPEARETLGRTSAKGRKQNFKLRHYQPSPSNIGTLCWRLGVFLLRWDGAGVEGIVGCSSPLTPGSVGAALLAGPTLTGRWHET